VTFAGWSLCLACGATTGTADPPSGWWDVAPVPAPGGMMPTDDMGWGWFPSPSGADREGWVFPLLDVTSEWVGLMGWSPDHPREIAAWSWGVPRPWGWTPAHLQQTDWITTDHPLDAWALRHAGIPALAWPASMHPDRPDGGDGSPLRAIEHDLAAVRRIVLAFQDHEPGHRFEMEMARRLGAARCARTRWSGRDLTEAPTRGALAVLLHHGIEALRTDIDQAPMLPIAGAYELFDVDDRFEALRELGLQPGVSTGFPSLDRFYTVKLAQWTLVHGIPSHGKSTLVDNIILALARRENWRFAVFPAENLPIERYYASLMEKLLGRPLVGRAGLTGVTEAEWSGWKRWLNDHVKVMLPPDDEGWTLRQLLETARILIFRHGVKGLVIDPWNELEQGNPDGLRNDTLLLNEQLAMLRRFVRANLVHGWVTAHPNRMDRANNGRYPVPNAYGIQGGAAWFNKPDVIIAPYRHVAEEDEDIVDLHIQKVRFREVGRPGLAHLRVDPRCGLCIDDINQDARRNALQSASLVPSAALRVPVRTPT